MTESVRSRALEVLGELKSFVQGQRGFREDAELVALYVITSTAEGAVLYRDIEEFARVCAQFAKKKAGEMGEDIPQDGGL